MPINSSWTIPGAGETECRIRTREGCRDDQSPRARRRRSTIEIVPAPYDNEEGLFVFRCLPMAEKYKTTVPIFASLAADGIDIGFEVQGKETVEVPAGKFECFKVLLDADQSDFLVLGRRAPLSGQDGRQQRVHSAGEDRASHARRNQKVCRSTGFPFRCRHDWYVYARTTLG